MTFEFKSREESSAFYRGMQALETYLQNAGELSKDVDLSVTTIISSDNSRKYMAEIHGFEE